MAADSKAKYLHEAEKYVLHGKVQQAIGEYLKIVKVDPHDVLTLNTIGDLYLRQNNIPEANRYFAQVAESYVRNNFFLKAIAVYRKILSADANNLEINSTIAALYAKQGLSVDARNQYLKVAALLEKAGRAKEVLDVYEKVVELDPANSTIQRKLADLHLEAGESKQAHAHFAGAARAQMKSRDYGGALDTFGRALQLDPTEADTLSGYLECCQEMGNVAPALERMKKSLEIAPENLLIRELLGQAYLAANEPEAACKIFQMIVSLDESRYEGFFAVTQALIDKETYNQAIGSLDVIIPILITRRETERAAQFYEQILERCPSNILPLIKLASIHSATGDQPRYLDALDKIADHYLGQKCPIEALEYLEKIIQADPQSEKHRELHKQAFTEAYPDTPYAPPVEPEVPVAAPRPVPIRKEPEAAPDPASPELVEADLLLNYGLRDKALNILRNLETSDPNNKEVRIRLLGIFKSENKLAEAAEQCLLLAALFRRSQDDDVAQDYLTEAGQLDPAAAGESDLEEYARLRGLDVEPLAETASDHDLIQADTEVDLSADLMDIFFVGDQDSVADGDSDLQQTSSISPDAMADEFSQELQQPPSKSMEEQLQEVDFYIRLGFHDEALAKLDELAKISPNHPELASRYAKLGGIETNAPAAAEAFDPSGIPEFAEPAPLDLGAEMTYLKHPDTDSDPVGFAIVEPESVQSQPAPTASVEPVVGARPAPAVEPAAGCEPSQSSSKNVAPIESDKSGFQANAMFADLMDDIGTGADQEVDAESFEDHFSLGTAYREMELLDEAIREFQNALKAASVQKDSQKIIQCCGMLSTCFLKQNMPSSVLRWCQTGLSIADISSHEATALRYDMGIAHSMAGSSERALECFARIFDSDPSYRDVAQRLDELKSGLNRHAP